MSLYRRASSSSSSSSSLPRRWPRYSNSQSEFDLNQSPIQTRSSCTGEELLDSQVMSVFEEKLMLQSTVAFLRLQFDNQCQPDVKFVVLDETNEFVSAHKHILSSKSPVFSKMFNSKMLEEETGMVRINDATLPVMRAVVKFCYDAEINFTKEVACEDVLEVAHKYEITFLLTICEKHLMETLSDDNLPKRFKLAKKLEMAGLETAATSYLKKHYDTVISRVIAELF